MGINDIKEKLNNLPIPKEGFECFQDGDVYWGKDTNGNLVFVKKSVDENTLPIINSTKYLDLFLNQDVILTNDGVKEEKRVSFIELKSYKNEFIELFIKLSTMLPADISEKDFAKYFSTLKKLFMKDNSLSDSELQGLFTELYSMYYLKTNFNIDISPYYQTEQKRKFDFSLKNDKKIEIKSTLKPLRTHKFRQEQLNDIRYQIAIISLMLREDDTGISLLDLLNRIEKVFKSNLKLLFNITEITSGIPERLLSKTKYDEKYLTGNIRIFNAKKVPSINNLDDDRIYNIEFDCDLSGVETLSIQEFKEQFYN